jgi:hypothetical protein
VEVKNNLMTNALALGFCIILAAGLLWKGITLGNATAAGEEALTKPIQLPSGMTAVTMPSITYDSRNSSPDTVLYHVVVPDGNCKPYAGPAKVIIARPIFRQCNGIKRVIGSRQITTLAVTLMNVDMRYLHDHGNFDLDQDMPPPSPALCQGFDVRLSKKLPSLKGNLFYEKFSQPTLALD